MLALIPARGGSKGIPRKNLKTIKGRSLLRIAIDEATKAERVTRVIVSTDCPDIKAEAEACGAEVPFIRPSHLATDTAEAIDVFLHAIDQLQINLSSSIDYFAVIQPTSPLRTAYDIDRAIDIFLERNSDSVVSVCEVEHPLEWMQDLDSNGILRPMFPDLIVKSLNRQQSQRSFVPNGAIFVHRTELLRSTRRYYHERTHAYVMERSRSIDIDTPFDLELARFMFERSPPIKHV